MWDDIKYNGTLNYVFQHYVYGLKQMGQKNLISALKPHTKSFHKLNVC